MRRSPPPDPADLPATQGPETAPWLVQPLPTPSAAERAWLEEWLELVGRPAAKADSGC